MRVAVAFVFLLISAAAASAQPRNPLYGEPSDFLGTWNNVELQRNMVVRIEIRPDYNHRVRVTVYGLRNGEPCVFGDYRGKFYVAKFPKEREQDNSAIMVKVEREFVHGYILLRFNGRGEIVSHALLNFEDHGPVYSVERFASGYRHDGYRSEGYGEGYSRPYPPRPYYGNNGYGGY
ncbi:MAG: hypothetical protein WBX25_01930 [Rhodomicrobium sp.]